MRRYEQLLQNVGRLCTRMGGAFVGERAVFRGLDLHANLKDMDWLELYTFGITGRKFTPPQLRLLHALWVYTSYPDPRLWNNRVAALAASARSTGALGLGAALSVSEARIYGPQPFLRAIDYFRRAEQQLAAGAALEAIVDDELRTRRGIGGYGRPLAAKDERIAPLIDLAKSVGLDQGVFVRLAFATDLVLRDVSQRLQMNYAALTAALLLDLGFDRNECYLFVFPIFLAGMPPCYIEAAQKPAGTLFPLPCSSVAYSGPGRRRWTEGLDPT